MATISATSVVSAARPWPAQMRVARAERHKCGYSKKAKKACEDLNLSPEVLKGLGLRRSSVPWGPRLVEDGMDTAENTRLQRLKSAFDSRWILACVLAHIFYPRCLKQSPEVWRTASYHLHHYLLLPEDSPSDDM
jgi:hypothetical protein